MAELRYGEEVPGASLSLHEAHNSCSQCGGPVHAHEEICRDCMPLDDSEDTSEDPTVLAPPAAYLARLNTEDSLEKRVRPTRRRAPPTPTPPPFADDLLAEEARDSLPTWAIVALGGLALSLLFAGGVLLVMVA